MLGLACADLPSEAEPALMKWASPGPALISRLGGHFPAGKCHRKEELWPLPRTQSPEGWGVGSLLGGSKDPRGMLIAASSSGTLGAPLQVLGAVPSLLQSHPLRDIRPPAPLPCQPRGSELGGPNWPYPAPLSSWGAVWGGMPRAREQSQGRTASFPRPRGPCRPELSPPAPAPG